MSVYEVFARGAMDESLEAMFSVAGVRRDSAGIVGGDG